jgi:glycosyltransferase involved in cell wall biosynthesis
MKIAHIVDSMEVGGAERITLDLCRWQKAQGHSVSVHCLFRGGPLVDVLQEAGVPVFIHCPRPEWHRDTGMGAKFRLIRSLYRSFRESRPDVVHCHNAFATIVGVPAARLAGAKRILSTRHGLNLHPQNPRQEIPFWLAARCATHVVAVCGTGGRNLAAGPLAAPRKLITVENGARPMAAADVPGGMARHAFQVVTVARLKAPKDHATLFRGLALASRTVGDLGLWVIGDGPDMPELKRLASELGIEAQVRFLGERHDVGSWLPHADLFALSSRSEGVPMSLLEAMAAGLPALVTAVGGMAEVVEFSEAGKAVPTGDPQAIARALEEFAADRAQLAVLGERARQCYLRHYTFERMAQRYMDLYTACSDPSLLLAEAVRR